MDALTVLQHKEILQDFWREWFNAYLGREVFQDRNRVFLDTSDMFLGYVEDCKRKHTACWMSVQPFRKRNEVAEIEKLFFDFDSDNDLCKAWGEARQFVLMLKTYYEVDSLLCFSGRKGYHVYVWLANPVEFSGERQTLAKRFYKTMQYMILKGLKLATSDKQVIGDIKRLSRVPYTVHEKSDNPCVPITLNHKPLLVLTLEGYRQHGLNPKFIELCLKQAKRTRRKRFSRFKMNMVKVRPCVEAALTGMMRGNNGHGMHLAVATEFLHAGYKPGDVAVLFQSQPDYSFEKSLFYVEDTLKRGYKPYKCRTIRSYGFCLGEKCARFKKQRVK